MREFAWEKKRVHIPAELTSLILSVSWVEIRRGEERSCFSRRESEARAGRGAAVTGWLLCAYMHVRRLCPTTSRGVVPLFRTRKDGPWRGYESPKNAHPETARALAARIRIKRFANKGAVTITNLSTWTSNSSETRFRHGEREEGGGEGEKSLTRRIGLALLSQAHSR